MTEEELVEAVGLVARLRRLEQKDLPTVDVRDRLFHLGVQVRPRGWEPPVTVSTDDIA